MIISIPSVIILSALILSLYGGSIRFTTPMLFALAFLPMFGIGGLTGLPLGLAATDIPLHDTNYVVGHFHYLVAPGTLFALFAGIYYWFPKITGRMMNETLGKIHFVGSLVGDERDLLADVHPGAGRREPAAVGRRRASITHAQAGAVPEHADVARGVRARLLPAVLHRQPVLEHASAGARADANPWEATTLEWATPTPPLAHGNFEQPPRAYRDPYDYSVPGAAADFTAAERTATSEVSVMEHSRTPPTVRPDTGLTNPKLGIWLFLASEVMLFGSLFSAYALLRTGAPSWPDQSAVLNVPLATLNTVILISSSVTMVLAWAGGGRRQASRGTGCSWG